MKSGWVIEKDGRLTPLEQTPDFNAAMDEIFKEEPKKLYAITSTVQYAKRDQKADIEVEHEDGDLKETIIAKAKQKLIDSVGIDFVNSLDSFEVL